MRRSPINGLVLLIMTAAGFSVGWMVAALWVDSDSLRAYQDGRAAGWAEAMEAYNDGQTHRTDPGPRYTPPF